MEGNLEVVFNEKKFLVEEILKKHFNQSFADREDLEQEGFLVLIDLIKNKNYKWRDFDNFARKKILLAMNTEEEKSQRESRCANFDECEELGLIDSGDCFGLCLDKIELELVNCKIFKKYKYTERDRRIIRLWEMGVPMATIGRMFNLSRAMISMKVKKFEHIICGLIKEVGGEYELAN